MNADLAITNGLLVDSKIIRPGVLYIKEGKIVGITRSLENHPRELIDAKGLYVLPGAIDGHVHMMDPGYTDREDFINRNQRSRQRRSHHGHRSPPHKAPGLRRKGALGKEGIPEDPFRRRFWVVGRFEPDQSWKSEGPVGGRGFRLQGIHV